MNKNEKILASIVVSLFLPANSPSGKPLPFSHNRGVMAETLVNPKKLKSLRQYLPKGAHPPGEISQVSYGLGPLESLEYNRPRQCEPKKTHQM